VREIVDFGKWINLSSAATFVAGQSDRIIMGLLLPAATFGQYAIARVLIDASQGLFERVNTALGLPVFREVLKENRYELGQKYYRYRLPFDVSAPLLAGILFAAGPLIAFVLFDERYAGAGEMVSILGLGLVIFPTLLVGVAFTAGGEPHVSALIAIIHAGSL
jgi:O-antigen/teichoic acid export membrane protein